VLNEYIRSVYPVHLHLVSRVIVSNGTSEGISPSVVAIIKTVGCIRSLRY
jgi:hypothetical protein